MLDVENFKISLSPNGQDALSFSKVTRMTLQEQQSRRFRDGTVGDIAGEGPAVILLHGVGLRRGIWVGQVAALKKHFTVITYDLLGHGESPRIAPGKTLDDFADQLAAVMDELGLATASVVGFSFGGLIVQRFAVKYPERLDKLVLMSSVYNRSDEERAGVSARFNKAKTEGTASIIDAAINRWFSPEYIAARPEVIADIRSGLESNHAPSFLTAYDLFCNSEPQLAGGLKAVKCPALAMAGEFDTGSTPAMVDRMVNDLENGRGVIIPGGRHMMPMEMAEEVNVVLLPFLSITT
jgi:pimeloyl-ACP methyl ester carboxylesterase